MLLQKWSIIIFALLLIPTCVRSSHLSCGAHGKCFYYTLSKKSHYNADQHCIGNGLRLASIHSYEQQVAVHDLMVRNGGQTTWLGGLDSGSEGRWYWRDGSTWSYTNWDSGQPSNTYWTFKGNENCLSLRDSGSGASTGKWNDKICGDELYFICARATRVWIPCKPSIHFHMPINTVHCNLAFLLPNLFEYAFSYMPQFGFRGY